MKKEKYDLINLQECHITTEEEAAQWELQFGGKLFYSSGTTRSLGQAVLINKSPMQSAELVFKDKRVIAVEIKHLDRTITIINTYAPCPTTEKIDFYRHANHVIEEITRNKDTDIILAGDLNSVMDNRKDIIVGENITAKKLRRYRTSFSTQT